jgi:hypothetical protein
MPKVITCPVCGEKSANTGFRRRMSWLKRHYIKFHPTKSRQAIRRVKRTDKQ